MVFSSLPPYQLDPAPNWQPHPPGGVCANNDTNSDFPIPPQPMPPPHGNSMAERSRLTKLPQQETGHKCPRCASTNTKFCYYNNYSLSQPRHFCKTCRRYWTRGGTLRNVPVGGGYRRNKKKSKRRSKSPVTNISTTIRTSPSNCTTDNFIGYNIVPHSVVPQFPLLPSLNHDSDFGAEENIASSFGRIQPPAFASSGYIDDPWRMQEFPILGERELPPSMTSSEYGIKAVDDIGPPQVNLVKFEENQEIMSLPKNSLEFQGNDYHRYWTNDAWNDPNSSRSSIDNFL